MAPSAVMSDLVSVVYMVLMVSTERNREVWLRFWSGSGRCQWVLVWDVERWERV